MKQIDPVKLFASQRKLHKFTIESRDQSSAQLVRPVSPSGRGLRARCRYRVGALLCVGLLLSGLLLPVAVADPEVAAKRREVRVVVDYGDGVQKHFTQLEWREEATVWDLLQAAAQHPRGLVVQHRGKGETLMVLGIDDVKNDGGSGRNWIFRVNGKLGERSAGISPILPGDAILWSFERYR